MVRGASRCLISAICIASLVPSWGKLHEFDEDDNETDLDKWINKYMEPYGVVVVAYVDHYSKNHELIQKLGASVEDQDTDSKNVSFAIMGFQMAAAVQWREPGNESLELVYRRAFVSLYTAQNLPIPNEHPLVYPSKPGAVWKEKSVRKWLLENSFPLVNIRIMDDSYGPFPEAKYMSIKSNPKGVVLIACDLSGDKEFKYQYQFSRALVPIAQKYEGKLRFSFIERHKKTKEILTRYGLGLNPRFECQLLIIDSNQDFFPEDKDTWNHFHGNPKKYLLENATEASIPPFFEEYEKKTLKTHWVSKEAWTWDTGIRPSDLATRISAPEFEEMVYESNPQKMKLVAFFNDSPEDNCETCPVGRRVWEEVAKIISRRKKFADKVDIMAIDQSVNEHMELVVPAKLSDPAVVLYPPGKAKVRKTKRRKMDILTEMITARKAEDVVEKIDDILMDDFDEL